MTIVMVNGGGNTPQGLAAKGGDERVIAVIPPLADTVDAADFVVWRKHLGTAVSDAASEFGLSHGAPDPGQPTVDLETSPATSGSSADWWLT